MADLDDVERMVRNWERGAAETAERYQRMQQQVEQISITESVASGAVSVTVGHNGLPTDVRMTDAVRAMSPDEIAANVLRAMRRAQSRYPERLREITAATVGDDDTTRHLVATAYEQFPSPPEEDEPAAPEPSGRELRVETEADEQEAPPRPPRPPRTAPPGPEQGQRGQDRRRPQRSDDDDEDFGDQSFLRRD
ncbi:YbaB/EbfC DNA-binding family protein [Amycolatopsis arida]|uniref:YbaB/EbfC DNA-binding family protein n=1 Tax=Amycolatopsis arida TaxID=587909 RepID=A0A1I5PGF5_9PSEU|nr:YbaB/EbfC family nucleoid-associated protein [Amycolatopsis arida]TDX98475.1 YbaB/EbfC DNA-binding family protein [Amycolatopsis arida]SFP32631.1 YbaB/EbfC DNA-binding family protein [Amycolatopsis arida]